MESQIIPEETVDPVTAEEGSLPEVPVSEPTAPKRKLKKWIIISAAAVALLAALIFALAPLLKPFYHYTMGKLMLRSGNYESAYYHLRDYVDYMDEKSEKAEDKTPNQRRAYQRSKKYLESQRLLKRFQVVYETATTTYHSDDRTWTDKIECRYDPDTNTIFYDHYSESELYYSDTYVFDNQGNCISKSVVPSGTEYYTYDENGFQTSCSDEDGNIRKKRTYDQFGNVLTDFSYTYGGAFTGRTEYTYDDHGNTLTETFYDTDGNPTGSRQYTYDKDGNLLTETHYDAGNRITEKEEHTYDKDGNLLTTVYYIQDETLNRRRENTYDKKGYLILSVVYNSQGGVFEKTEYKNDKNGNCTYKADYDTSGNVTSIAEYEYDKNGYLTKFISREADGEIGTYLSFEYDKDGNLLRRTDHYTNGDKQVEYKYDEDGNLLKVASYSEAGLLLGKRECEYDKHGNLLCETSYKGHNIDKEIVYEGYRVIYTADD